MHRSLSLKHLIQFAPNMLNDVFFVKTDRKIVKLVDSQTLGKATSYDCFSAQLVWKLPVGKHEFWVKGDSGSDSVTFEV